MNADPVAPGVSAYADSALRVQIGSGNGRAWNNILQMGFHACQPFIHAEHLPIQPANCGEDRKQQGAIEPSVLHVAELMAARQASSTISFSGVCAVMVRSRAGGSPNACSPRPTCRVIVPLSQPGTVARLALIAGRQIYRIPAAFRQ